MNAARTTLGLWLLLQLLLGGLHSPMAAVPQGERTAAQWHNDTARHDRADALLEHQRAQRTANPVDDDLLVGTGAPTPHPAGPQAQPATAMPSRTDALARAAYRARAPPTAA